jgi:hypothetical protein
LKKRSKKLLLFGEAATAMPGPQGQFFGAAGGGFFQKKRLKI